MDRRKKVLWFVACIHGTRIMGGTRGRIVKWHRAIDHGKYEVHILLSCKRKEDLRAVQAEYAKKGITIDVLPGLRGVGRDLDASGSARWLPDREAHLHPNA